MTFFANALWLTSPCIDSHASSCEGHNESDWVHYVIVRADLSIGSQVAQAIHGAGESTPTRVPPNTVAVALHAKDQAHLLKLHEKLKKAEIAHVLIAECDGEAMAIGIEPTRDRQKVRKAVSDLPLVR